MKRALLFLLVTTALTQSAVAQSCGNAGSVTETGDYAVVNSDKALIVNLAGASDYAATVGVPTDYDADFCQTIVNADTTRRKRVILDGSVFNLHPHESMVFQRNGAAWLAPVRHRWMLDQNITLYVDNDVGDDDNDGLVPGRGGALKTPQRATIMDLLEIDRSGKSITVQLADSATPYPGTHYAGAPVGVEGGARMRFQGNCANPWTTIVQGDAGSAFAVYNEAIVQVRCMVIGSRNGGHGLEAGYHAHIYGFDNLIFWTTSDVQAYAFDYGLIELTQPWKVAGSASQFAGSDGVGMVKYVGRPITVEFLTDATYSFRFAAAYNQSSVDLSGIIWRTNGHTVTGQSAEVAGLSLIKTGTGGDVNYFPGNHVVTIEAGSLYH